MKLTSLLLGFWLGLVLVSTAEGGPNAGGVLILHWNTSVVYSPGVTTYCGQSELPSCNDAVTRANTATTLVLHALAAFPLENVPRLAGVCFGVQYDESQTFIVDWGACGDFELPNSGWPGSVEGNCVTWNEAQTDHVTEIYWFAAYSIYGNSTQLALRGHPSGGGSFGDDDVPANLDPIADYGTFGFYTDGYLPCPNPRAACCFADGSCIALTEVECAAQGGVYQGDGTECTPQLCEPVPTLDTTWGRVKYNYRDR
jgi:hypothetical protein